MFKTKLDEIRAQQKTMIRDKTAAVCGTEWHVGNSRVEGRRMTERYLRLQLRAFNGECDAAIVKVRYNNVTAMEGRIRRSFETLNKLGETQHCSIVPEHLDLKLSEGNQKNSWISSPSISVMVERLDGHTGRASDDSHRSSRSRRLRRRSGRRSARLVRSPASSARS